MDYIKKTYTDKAIEVQISSFAGKGGVTEYHVLLTITDRTLPFSGQLQNIQRAYVAVIQEVLPDEPGRLGDGLGMRKFLLPSFHRGASSTKREQNSHVDLVSDRYHCRNDQKRNVESQTQPLYTILDRGLLQ